jgi:hypothetical protein
MANATVRANAQPLPEATSRRAILGAVLAAGALAAVPSRGAAANLGLEPELQALIDAWHEANRRLEATYDASCAASERAFCHVPQALIATESDTNLWATVPGRRYRAADVSSFRALKKISLRFDQIFSLIGYDDRTAEIIASWDSWQAECEAAKEREGVARAEAVWSQAVEDYHAMGARVAKLRATTMAGVIAKLLAAAPHVTEDDLEDPTSSNAVLASAALDAQSLANVGAVAEDADRVLGENEDAGA